MKKILVISGHPDLKNSFANATILAEFEKNLPNVEIRKLDELYPNYNFDVATEQKFLENADVIIFQYPFHWYDVPGILKLYIDKIMLHSWAYGSKGNARLSAQVKKIIRKAEHLITKSKILFTISNNFPRSARWISKNFSICAVRCMFRE